MGYGIDMVREIVVRVIEQLQRPTVVAIFIALFTISIATRLLTGSAKRKQDGGLLPAMPPYWVPFLGHGPQLDFNMHGFLARQRQAYPEGIFSLYLRGSTHTFLSDPELVSQLLSQPSSKADGEWASQAVRSSVFGSNEESDALVHGAFMEEELLKDPGLTALTQSMVQQLKDHVPDLVTFNTWPVDQMEWERFATADVVETGNEDESVVDVSLMDLVKNFVAQTQGAALFGTDFATNVPEVWSYLWIMDNQFRSLASKFMPWVPWPGRQRGKLARRRLRTAIYELQDAMDKQSDDEEPGARWSDLHNVSPLVARILKESRKRGAGDRDRASDLMRLAFTSTVTAAPLICWMLFEMSRDAVLLAQIRDEIAPYVHATQPKNEFGMGVWVPPTLEKLDVDALMNCCPLLEDACVETLRVYSASWELRLIREDVLLRKKAEGKDAGEAYLLKKGSLVHAPQDLHNFDPGFFADPQEWESGRHIKEMVDDKGTKTKVAELGTIKAFGGGPTMCKGRDLAMRQMLTYAAVIITLYEIGPPKGKEKSWNNVRTRKSAQSRYPVKEIRAWIRRRKLPLQGKIDG